jgi:hypothetical protein
MDALEEMIRILTRLYKCCECGGMFLASQVLATQRYGGYFDVCLHCWNSQRYDVNRKSKTSVDWRKDGF